MRGVHHAIFVASRHGRDAEIVAWSNAASSFAVAGFVVAASWSHVTYAAWLGLGAAAVTFVALRFALTHRITVWVAAALGTLTIGALGGGLAWVLAHVIEGPAVIPAVAAIGGGLLAASVPASAYARLAARRAGDVPDSLLEPMSAPHSR